MKTNLKEDLEMTKPFSSVYEETLLQLMRTSDILGMKNTTFFKSYGTTEKQYNVLRILRGAGDSGLPTLSIAKRMVTHSPDISRLIDRLIKNGFVVRDFRNIDDRRVIKVTITKKGLDLVNRIDKPILKHIKNLMEVLSEEECKLLSKLLEKLRKQ